MERHAMIVFLAVVVTQMMITKARDVEFRRPSQQLNDPSTNNSNETIHWPNKSNIPQTSVIRRTQDCGIDRSFPPECVGVLPTAYKLHRSVQAVGRLTIATTVCSGVLLGNTTNAFFLTAASCIPWDYMLDQVLMEFTNCIGSQFFTSDDVLHLNRDLNYVVLRLVTRGFSVASHYGFLRLRPSGPDSDEVVFVPHYTTASTKRISIVNDEGFVRIQRSETINYEANVVPTSQMQYKVAQLDEVAIGAPVMSLTDYSVVALHLCGGCHTGAINTAVSTDSILADLNSAGKLIPAFVTS